MPSTMIMFISNKFSNSQFMFRKIRIIPFFPCHTVDLITPPPFPNALTPWSPPELVIVHILKVEPTDDVTDPCLFFSISTFIKNALFCKIRFLKSEFPNTLSIAIFYIIKLSLSNLRPIKI